MLGADEKWGSESVTPMLEGPQWKFITCGAVT